MSRYNTSRPKSTAVPSLPYCSVRIQYPVPDRGDRVIAHAPRMTNNITSTCFYNSRVVHPYPAPTQRARDFTAGSVVICRAHPHVNSPLSTPTPLPDLDSACIAGSNDTIHRGTSVPLPLPPRRLLRPSTSQSSASSHVVLRCCPSATGQHPYLQTLATS